jgi:phospholipase C
MKSLDSVLSCLIAMGSLFLPACGTGIAPNSSRQASSGSGSSTGSGSGGLQSANHIIIFVQENRSFDHYFGALRAYWAQNGFPDQSFDGLPEFNPATGADPVEGPASAIPGCDPAEPFPQSNVCKPDTSNLIFPVFGEVHRRKHVASSK